MAEQLLARYIPKEKPKASIVLLEEFVAVIENIARVLPPKTIWDYYASTPKRTGGKVIFPYARVDSLVIDSWNNIVLLRLPNPPPDEVPRLYTTASTLALQALVWVEIGFEGLENLARSPASRNWTNAVDIFADDSQRAERIIKEGRKLYEECLGAFLGYRIEKGIREDCFTQYNLEYLLSGIKPIR